MEENDPNFKDKQKNIISRENYFSELWKIEEEPKEIIPKIIYLDYSTVPITKDIVIQCFYSFYLNFTQENIKNMIQSLETLRFLAQSAVLDDFPEFYQFNISKMFIHLLLSDVKEIKIGVIRFLAELGKSPKQKLFLPIVKLSYYRNLLLIANNLFGDSYFILDVLKCLLSNVSNFEYAFSQVFCTEYFDFFRRVLLIIENDNIKTTTIKIISILLKPDKITNIHMSIGLNFLVCLFQDYPNKTIYKPGYIEYYYTKFLTLAKKLITDQNRCSLVLDKFKKICYGFIMKNKNVSICANSIFLLGKSFDFNCNINFDWDLKIFLKRLIKLSHSSHDTISRATLHMLSNFMENDVQIFHFLINQDIITICVNKILGNFTLATKFKSLLIIYNIISKGPIEYRSLFLNSNVMESLLQMAIVDKEEFSTISLQCIYLLLQMPSYNPKYNIIWDIFGECDGYDIITEIMNINNQTVCILCHEIMRLKK